MPNMEDQKLSSRTRNSFTFPVSPTRPKFVFQNNLIRQLYAIPTVFKRYCRFRINNRVKSGNFILCSSDFQCLPITIRRNTTRRAQETKISISSITLPPLAVSIRVPVHWGFPLHWPIGPVSSSRIRDGHVLRVPTRTNMVISIPHLSIIGGIIIGSLMVDMGVSIRMET